MLFLSCRSFVVIATLLTGLVGVEVTCVSWLGQLTVGVKSLIIVIVGLKPRPVENVLTTKGLQERNIQMLDGTTGENKGKTIN